MKVTQWLIRLLDVTVEVYTLSLQECTKLKGLLEVASTSAKLETIAFAILRHKDALRRIYDRVPVKLERADCEAPPLQDVLAPSSSRLAVATAA